MANTPSLIMGWTGDTNDTNTPIRNDTYSFCGFLIKQNASNGPSWTPDSRGFQAGTLSQMQVRVRANGAAATTFTINGTSTTNQTISVGSSATGLFTDNTHSDAVAAGNDLDVIQTATPNLALVVSIVGFTFTATTAGNTVTRIGCYNQTGPNSAGATNYEGLGSGGNTSQQTEADAKMRMRKSFTIKNMGGINDNSTTNFTMSSRKNGAAGNLSAVTGGGGPPSTYADSSHSDSVVSGDDWNLTYIDTSHAGGTGLTANIDFISTNGDCPFICGNSALTSVSTSVTTYFGLTGSLATADATEAHTQVQVNSAFVFSQLLINLITNGNTGTSTINLRANSGNAGSVSVSIASQATGIHIDSTDSYTAATSDLMNYQIVTSSTGNAMTISQISVNGNATPGAAAGGPSYQHFDNTNQMGRQDYNSFGGQLVVFG